MNQNSLKGLLIILVIFDHNEYAHQLFPEFLRGFSFHVLGFFSLPFLRSAEPFNVHGLKKMFVAYLYPYLWLATAMALLTAVLQHRFSITHLQEFVCALYSGNALLLKRSTGMSLLWFLPAFFSLMCLRALSARQTVSASKFMIAGVVLLHPFISLIPATLQALLPLGLLPALYAMPLVLVLTYLQTNFIQSWQPGKALLVSSLLFIAAKYTQMRMNLTQELGFVDLANYHQWAALIINDLEGICGVLMLFQLARFDFPSLLKACGQYSLQVYLFHAFFALILYRLLERYSTGSSTSLLLMFSMISTILITLLFARQLEKIKLFHRILFPKIKS